MIHCCSLVPYHCSIDLDHDLLGYNPTHESAEVWLLMIESIVIFNSCGGVVETVKPVAVVPVLGDAVAMVAW